jgi:RNA polymerase sigma factor (sigma-70 family)
MYLEAMECKGPSLEQAYLRLRPMFFAALGSLARQGFIVAPGDSMDLIHDFFSEAWQGLLDRFNPNRGTFESYAYRAFVQFARPRIVRLARWQGSLIGAEKLDAFPSKSSEASDSVDTRRVYHAVAKLPSMQQEVLLRYAYSEYPSERALARDLGMSRYRLREILVNALGHLAVSFDRPELIAPQDWAVALAMWREGRTVKETASLLGLTQQQVRSAYQRNFLFFAAALKNYEPHTWSPERKENMATQAQTNFALVLLDNALHRPGDRELLEQVRVLGKRILEALDDSIEFLNAEEQLDPSEAQWVADVYEAIFEGAGMNLQPDVIAAEAAEAHESEDTSIGRAFREALLADLNEDLRYPTEVRSLPKISPKERERLARAPDVQAGRPESEQWLAHGIRPLTVFLAAKSVSGLLDHYLRKKRLPPAPIILRDASVLVAGEARRYLLTEVLTAEISDRAECSSLISGALYTWMLKVGQYKPWLFPGFEAAVQPGGHALQLTRAEQGFRQPYQFWGLTSSHHNVLVAG